jgi:ribonuclease E
MPNKMLVDASHPEETRVVVVRGNRIEEFDFESQDKKQLKGNIYLARVTRVEPSLQAAFVEYGGNRHGFLAFSEIHPDYYQIPVADRQALLRAEAEAAESEDDEETDSDEREDRNRGRRRRRGRHRDREERRAEGDAAEAGLDAEASDTEVSDVEAVADADEASPEETASAPGDEQLHGDEVEQASPEAARGPEAGERAEEMTAAEAEASGEAEFGETHVLPAEAEIASAEEATPDEAEKPRKEEASQEEDSSQDAESGRPVSIAAAVDADVISEPVKEAEAESAKEAEVAEEAVVTENESGGIVEEVHSAHADESEVESVGAEDALEEIRNRRRPPRRNYKIQEVIKRRQILLVQVVKEERGNKGAALTTYLSLAGRYSVLMPNTARGGGISRKITNAQDRKRLKEVVADLDVPQGMGVILRTAGESRTKAEIKRDYEYLMRLWENVRNLTLQSTAPALVYEEGSLIKRSVRDLYNKDIDEILVSGEEGYREAKDFMRMLMPSHAKVVQPYRDNVPIFARAGIEAQLDRMLQPQVTLKSGGYIIINQTEALVSIDVNSGRSTKEHSIEDTALQTNLEAAEEVARQLRLRDLAGLIVIDFIDMEENRNNRAVEKRLKDCLKNDRARIQVGRISHFGLLEMSRQRIRASVLESTMKPCPHCGGTGHVRSDSSVALHVVRAIEEFLLKDSRSHIIVKTPAATALYVLNHKRSTLVEMERRFGVTITLEADETLGAQPYAIFRGAIAEKPVVPQEGQPMLPPPVEEEEEIEVDFAEEAEVEPAERPAHGEHNGHAEHRDRKRRRRRRRRGGREHGGIQDSEAPSSAAHGADDEADFEDDGAEDGAEETEVSGGGEAHALSPNKKRRRGKRGGRRNRQQEADAEMTADGTVPSPKLQPDDISEVEVSAPIMEDVAEADAESMAVTEREADSDESDAKARRTSRRPKREDSEQPAAAGVDTAVAETSEAAEPMSTAASTQIESNPIGEREEEPAPTTHWTRRRPSDEAAPAEPVVVSSTAAEESKPKKAGWWQRKGFF